MKLPHTKAALVVYDQVFPDLDAMLDKATTSDALLRWEIAAKLARMKVQDAFYEDCMEQDIPNSRAHCALADIDTLRRWAAGGV